MKPVHPTKAVILDAALELASLYGFRNITRKEIACNAAVGTGTVSYHFKSMKKLQDAIMSWAVVTGKLQVIGQGLAEGHKAALAAAPHLRAKAAKLLAA